nr:flavonol sulfotransferase-like [Ipomoea batatas]
MATPTQSSCEAKTIDKLIADLPREKGWIDDNKGYMHLYNGFWHSTWNLPGLLALQQHFKPHPNDVLLASFLKSGTTWLKALVFSVVNRAKYNVFNHPLLTSNPHDLVPHLDVYATENPTNPRPAESPLFHTHIPYQCFPHQHIHTSSSLCRIVYVFRDPKDVLVSLWHFISKLTPKHISPISLQEAFHRFSRGVSPFGPYWDHVAAYYKASVQFPNKVLFLRYEDLKTDTVVHVKKLAAFLGQPFSEEEENEGTVQKIIDLCGFEKLRNLEVNKDGLQHGYARSNPVVPTLPEQIRSSSCRIVYVFRDPKDVLVSFWHFLYKMRPKESSSISLQEAFNQFSRGASPFGPYWDHRLAEFVGWPFSEEEENEGVVQKITDLCSFDKLSNLEANKNGSLIRNLLSTRRTISVINNAFFRKGDIGDSKNHLSEEMREILDQIAEDKFNEIGLTTFVPLV